ASGPTPGGRARTATAAAARTAAGRAAACRAGAADARRGRRGPRRRGPGPRCPEPGRGPGRRRPGGTCPRVAAAPGRARAADPRGGPTRDGPSCPRHGRGHRRTARSWLPHLIVPGRPATTSSTVHSLTRAGRVGVLRCGVRCRVTRLLGVVLPRARRGLLEETCPGGSGVLRVVGALIRLAFLLLGLAGRGTLALGVHPEAGEDEQQYTASDDQHHRGGDLGDLHVE